MDVFPSMKYSLSAATIVLLLIISATTGSVLTSLTSSSSSQNESLTIDASSVYGVNTYTLLEVDEGDNDEESVITDQTCRGRFGSLFFGEAVGVDEALKFQAKGFSNSFDVA